MTARPVEVTPDKKVVVRDSSLLPSVVGKMMRGMKTPGDWIWDESTGKGWMRRRDGKIAELSAGQVKILQAAGQKGGNKGAEKAIEVVLKAIAG